MDKLIEKLGDLVKVASEKGVSISLEPGEGLFRLRFYFKLSRYTKGYRSYKHVTPKHLFDKDLDISSFIDEYIAEHSVLYKKSKEVIERG